MQFKTRARSGTPRDETGNPLSANDNYRDEMALGEKRSYPD